MKKAMLLVLVIFCFITVIFICGCSEQNNTPGITGITMTAKELYNNVETIEGPGNITINYKSLNDGDTLIVQDTNFKIFFDFVFNETKLIFVWDGGDSNNSLEFEFEGNITGSYSSFDQVKITVKIKHVKFSFRNINYDLELFEEQWVNEEYYVQNGTKPLPPSCITKA